MPISIHTPHTRCDSQFIDFVISVIKFQSTHLIRGVTKWVHVGRQVHMDFNPHTSYEVWRKSYPRSWYLNLYFNPHTSYEVWLDSLSGFKAKRPDISIHTPHTRCDVKVAVYVPVFTPISIHTPHTRCDIEEGTSTRYLKNISIHTPHTRCDLLNSK